MCHINGPSVQDEPQMPFGGVKGSGYGRFGGKASVPEFTDLRWITISSGPGQYPIEELAVLRAWPARARRYPAPWPSSWMRSIRARNRAGICRRPAK